MSGCPVDHGERKGDAGGCPADHGQSLRAFAGQPPAMNPHNNMPLTPEQHGNNGLSTERTVSSIPRADRYEAAGPSECPAVDNAKEMWVYPSEQMFFNAMRRKNWDPQAPDMKTVVPIHNTVNEECWRQILEWEKRHASACGTPKLLRFEGKAKQMTPKARLRSLVGYQPPFDRHDWTVDRCGTRVTYVIDFYEGRRDPSNPHKPSFFLDVRPALTAAGAWDRVCRFFGS
ncbi:Cytochrome c1 heme lyase [Coemansia nantahalensis]|uniref:Cytochrome c1 heme lyase n=2 Tax=Coemansia TaxID=4863 RepID=A0ACC1LI01_9FUNG|nr:Cytochrome c1 heme lyase [Coemansia nantahalensis]KAJ2807971.1 Cytochrome c1 heme lyase [Coemansia helicoidea]